MIAIGRLARLGGALPLVAKAEDAQGFTFAMDASVDFRAGNTDFLLLSRAAVPRFRAGPHRLSTYLSLAWRRNEWVKAGITAYAQPRLGRISDVRALLEAELIVTVAAPLSIRGSATLAYDSEPPFGLEPLDAALKGAIHLEW